MPASRPADAGSRGPVRPTPPARPSGYRVTDEQRAALLMAGRYTERESLQAIIDLAVQEFLNRTAKRAGFAEALESAKLPTRRRRS